MKRRRGELRFPLHQSFSTLNSGLRDETKHIELVKLTVRGFQYPQLGPTR